MTGSPDFYAVLHLGPEATGAEVNRAYRSLMRRHHPDTRPSPATAEQASRESEQLRQIMDAYTVLADPAQRARYDRGLLTKAGAAASHPGPSNGARVHRPPAPRYGQPPIVAGPLRWEPPR
ncbi:DnaJ domain-containing protein [Arthrobacter sp.]|uniref:J domain-containing protein n=1 Tax=Arthrobacter sp. TaxID=1667 RepID=UPI0025857353|nr:DnaJ domain-containing protein [Arthrobacter sp.]